MNILDVSTHGPHGHIKGDTGGDPNAYKGLAQRHRPRELPFHWARMTLGYLKECP